MQPCETLVFVVPHAIREGLLESDADQYALSTYPKQVASEAAVIMTTDYSERIANLDISKKKRVKLIAENLAVALSLPVSRCNLMSTARTIYRQWMDASNMFGDNQRQNKYWQRIFRQLSQPFAMNNPTSSDHFQGEFYPLLLAILNDYQHYIEDMGAQFSEITWLTLIKVLIAVTDIIMKYDFTNLLSPDRVSALRQLSAEVLFKSVVLSGILATDIWQILTKYCNLWNDKLDFIDVWGRYLTKVTILLFSNLFSRKEDVSLVGGVYPASNPIPNANLTKILHFLLSFVDVSMTLSNPSLLLSLQTTINKLVKSSQEIVESKATTIIPRFPATIFMQLFGKFLISIPDLPEEFDPAQSVLIETYLIIISSFEFGENKDLNVFMIQKIAKLTKSYHQTLVDSTLYRLHTLYSHNKAILPYISELALDLFQHIKPGMPLTYYNNISSLFISAAEYIEDTGKLLRPFKDIWSITESKDSRLRLISYSTRFENELFGSMEYLFSSKCLANPENASLLSGYILVLSTAVRFNTSIGHKIVEMQVIPHILSSISKINTAKYENFEILVVSSLQFLYSVVEWCSYVFDDSDTTKELFKFVDFVQKALSSAKKDRKSKKSPSATPSSPWIAKHKHFIRSLVSVIVARVNLSVPIRDHFTRVYNSSSEISEESLVKLLNIEKETISFFTIGTSSLVSFIEGKSSTDSKEVLAIITRGPYGKAMWRIKDNFEMEFPKLSDSVKKEEILPLSYPVIEKVSIGGLGESKAFPEFDKVVFESNDEVLKAKFMKGFQSWLDWSKYGFYEEYGHQNPVQRARVIDFLLTTGILDSSNTLQVRPQKDIQLVRSKIRQFDALENNVLIGLPVIHLTNKDDTPAVMHKRMTPLFKQFMSSIGEPLDLAQTATDSKGFPQLKTNVPVIPSIGSSIVFLSPCMAQTEKGANEIYDMSNTSFMKIIFNETDFDLDLPLSTRNRKILLVVKPLGNDRYFIKELSSSSEQISPFSDGMVLTSRHLAFNIALCYEYNAKKVHRSVLPHITLNREAILEELCQQPAPIDLSTSINSVF